MICVSTLWSLVMLYGQAEANDNDDCDQLKGPTLQQ